MIRRTPTEGTRSPIGLVSICVALVALGLFARLGISLTSYGTNDVTTWHRFAEAIRSHGLVESYRTLSKLNHPPLAAMWAALAGGISERAHLPFGFIFRLPAIAADAAACVILALVWRRRAGRASALPLLAAAAMALNLDAILVSGFHGNTDNIYAMLVLLSVYLLADRRWPLAGGLALAAAINVKIIPLILIPPMFAIATDRRLGPPASVRRSAARFVMGLAIGGLPLLLALVIVGKPFFSNALAYTSDPNRWGIIYVTRVLRNVPHLHAVGTALLVGYHTAGRFAVLGAAIVLAWLHHYRRPWDAYELISATLIAWLVLAPGFGVQYTVALAPLLLAVSIRLGSLYGLVSGLFLLLTYWTYRTSVWPARSEFEGMFPHRAAVAGCALWVMLAWMLWASVRKHLRRGSPASSAQLASPT
jgi:Gpi18-like mannosyltransferase